MYPADAEARLLALVEVLRRTTQHFKERGIPSARLDAELLLAAVLGLERVGLYLNFDRPLTDDELAALRPLVRRRAGREPLAWILGSRDFWKITLQTPPGVLVPRSDTEILVEAALALIPEDQERFVADVGSGTGAVGLSLAWARPLLKLYATDLSPEALAATRENAAALGVSDRVAVLKGPLLDPVPPRRPIDLVVSNPPYIPSAAFDALAPEIRDHEPRLALDGGTDGLDVYRRLIPAAARRAREAVLVEVGDGQADAVSELFRAAGLTDVRTHADLSGMARVVEGRVPKPSPTSQSPPKGSPSSPGP